MANQNPTATTTEQQVSRLSDPYIRRHLQSWLDEQIHGEQPRALVAGAMVDLVLTDEEYFSSQSWWNVYDLAKCNDIER